MTDKTVTFTVDDDLRSAFEKAAKAQNRTSDETLRQLMRDFIVEHDPNADYDNWFMQQVEEGLADANAGNLVSSEEVTDYFAALREKTRRNLRNQR